VVSDLDRRAAVTQLLVERRDLLVVTGLGSPAYDACAAGDHGRNFYLWGAMGGAVPMGLGLAVARPRERVLVITGDGEMLMGLGSLAVVGAERPENLAVVVLDNERYGETGMQETHTARGTDLAAMARSAGIPTALTVTDEAGVDDLAGHVARLQGPLFATVKVRNDPLPLVLPPRDGRYVKDRFRVALLGEPAAVR